MLEVISNLIFLLLFARMAQSSKNRFYFNPVLSAPHSMLDGVFSFLRPVFFSIPERAISGILLLLLIVFRGAIYVKTGLPQIVIGGNCVFEFTSGLFAGPLASLFEFLVFLTRFWGLCALISFISSCTASTRVHQALMEFGKPFTSFPKPVSPIALFAANLIVVAILAALADCTYTASVESATGIPMFRAVNVSQAIYAEPGIRSISALAVLSLFAMADLVIFTRGALLISIFASLIAIIFQRRELAFLFMEFQNVILGFFSKKTLRAGMFDFTPVLFFIGLNILYSVIAFFLLPLLFNTTGILQDLPPIFN